MNGSNKKGNTIENVDNIEYRSWFRPSSSGEGEVFSCIYSAKEPKAIFQIAHGMCEYSGRYKEFAQALALAGYVVCANDHLGHGESHLNHRGTFATTEGGFDYVIQDMDSLFMEMKQQYPELPCILLGHSMGSILSALFAEKYQYLSALILMGAPAQNKLTGFAKWLLTRNVKKHGYLHQSKLCNYLMWGREATTEEQKRKSKSWLSYNQDNIERFIQDEQCNFTFSDSANLELVQGLSAWGDGSWGEKIADIPILVIAGAEDAIGGKGKGPTYYYNQLKKYNKSATLELIANNQHEVLNEDNREETYGFIMKWLENSLEEEKK